MTRYSLLSFLIANAACFDFTPVTYGGPGAQCDFRDRACRDGFECSTDGVCVLDCTECGSLIPGDTCVAAADCRSGVCVEGLCCDAACDGVCSSCAGRRTGQPDGACSVVLESAAPHPECGGAACDGEGHCKGSRGSSCANARQCDSGFCYDGLCCNEDCGGLCEACSRALTANADGFCLSTLPGKERGDECTGAVACNGAGACFGGALGSGCDDAFECNSGFCVDGVCCDGACDGTCQACGATGACFSVASAEDSGTCDNDVGCSQPPCSCDAGSICGRGAGVRCNQPSDCASGFCADGVCCDSACDGICRSCLASYTQRATGTCGNVVGDPGNECPILDGFDTQCVAGACNKIPRGGACSAAANCVTGFCVDGFCCEHSCSSVCVSCAGPPYTTASAGTCRVVGGGDPYDECPGSQTCDWGQCSGP